MSGLSPNTPWLDEEDQLSDEVREAFSHLDLPKEQIRLIQIEAKYHSERLAIREKLQEKHPSLNNVSQETWDAIFFVPPLLRKMHIRLWQIHAIELANRAAAEDFEREDLKEATASEVLAALSPVTQTVKPASEVTMTMSWLFDKMFTEEDVGADLKNSLGSLSPRTEWDKRKIEQVINTAKRSLRSQGLTHRPTTS